MNKLICEFCGEEDKESLRITLDKWACWKCYPTKRYIERKIEETKEDREGCTCHGCCSLSELGYYKENNIWIKN